MVTCLLAIMDTFSSRGRKECIHGSNSTETTWISGHICKSSVACSSDFLYQTSSEQLREIVNLSKVLIDSIEAQSSCRFSLDAHVIFPLAVVGLRFRHRALSGEAVALLLNRRWREGVWDSWVVGRTMEWIADMEDEGLTDEEHHECVPGKNAAREVQMQHDVAGRKTTVSCLQLVRGMILFRGML